MLREGNRFFTRHAASALGFACAVVTSQPGYATTLLSTKLSDIAAHSNAVVQGIVVEKVTLIDAQHVPWTIYKMDIENVLSGEISDKEFGFRCIGGPNGDRSLVLSGTPSIRVGDSIVAFLNEDSVCQLSGLEFGVFWKRKDSTGIERIVDHQGRVVGALGGDDVVPSLDIVPFPKDLNVPETHVANVTEVTLDARFQPPAAPADAILSEFEAFSRAYAEKSGVLRSTLDLAGISTFEQGPAPKVAPEEKRP